MEWTDAYRLCNPRIPTIFSKYLDAKWRTGATKASGMAVLEPCYIALYVQLILAQRLCVAQVNGVKSLRPIAYVKESETPIN